MFHRSKQPTSDANPAGSVQEAQLGDFVAAHAEGALTVDVREPDEFTGGHVPGARNIPLASLGRHVQDLARVAASAPVYVICASGGRSKAAAGLLAQAGLDARSVAGGTAVWLRAGHPVATGTQPA